jgi:hypothetical protein
MRRWKERSLEKKVKQHLTRENECRIIVYFDRWIGCLHASFCPFLFNRRQSRDSRQSMCLDLKTPFKIFLMIVINGNSIHIHLVYHSSSLICWFMVLNIMLSLLLLSCCYNGSMYIPLNHFHLLFVVVSS